MIDRSGEYGMGTGCAAIIDSIKNLELILTAMKSKRFVPTIRLCGVGQNDARYNPRIIPLLRRDFWKDFVDKDGNEIP